MVNDAQAIVPHHGMAVMCGLAMVVLAPQATAH